MANYKARNYDVVLVVMMMMMKITKKGELREYISPISTFLI